MSEILSPRRRSSWKSLSDLTSEQIAKIKYFNELVCSTQPPRRPSYSDSYGYAAYARFEALNFRARAERSNWLLAYRIPLRVALRVQ